MEKLFKKNEIILKEGDIGNEAYIINAGKVEVYRSKDKTRVVLATLSEGQIFGEMSMIDDRPRSANILALEDTEVTVINREEFNKNYYSNPEKLTLFLKKIFERLRNIDQGVIENTVSKTAEAFFEGKMVLEGVTPKAAESLGNKPFEIKKFPYKVGRKTNKYSTDLFSNNDLYLNDTMPFNVSRNHFSLQYFKDRFMVIDRGSTLGTLVNSEKIGGAIREHEIELKRNKDNIIVVGTNASPFIFKVMIS